MRSSFLLASTLASALTAQNNRFEIHSGCTNYTDRGTLSVSAGEMLMQVNKNFFLGIGHDAGGTAATIAGFVYATQDERPVTQETYYLVVRAEANGGGPLYPGTPMLRGGPLTTPVSASTTPQAWIITATLTTPATVPLCDSYYFGGELAAAPLWINPPGQDDGQSFHISSYYLLGGTQGDNPALNAPNLTWNVNFASNVVNQPTYAICTQIGMLVPSAVLNMGNEDPTATVPCLVAQGGQSFGAGGLWPACSPGRSDGLRARVRDLRNANGQAVLFFGAPLSQCPGLSLGGIANGALYLDPNLFVFVGGVALDAQGVGNMPLLPPGSNACPVNRFSRFQAFTVGPAFTLPGNLTNFAVTRYLP